MPLNIVFETARFSGPDPNTPSGEEFVRWISEKLKPHGVDVGQPQKKAGGWEFDARHGNARYVVTVGLQRAGAWKVSVDKRRSLSDQLLGKNRLSPTDPFVWLIENALQGDPDIKNVRRS